MYQPEIINVSTNEKALMNAVRNFVDNRSNLDFNPEKSFLQAVFLHEDILQEQLAFDSRRNIWEFDESTILQQFVADKGGYLFNELPVMLGLSPKGVELFKNIVVAKVEQLIDLRIQRVEDGMMDELGIDIHSLKRINQLFEIYKHINPDGLNRIQEKVLDFYTGNFEYMLQPLPSGKFDSMRSAVLNNFVDFTCVTLNISDQQKSFFRFYRIEDMINLLNETTNDPFQEFFSIVEKGQLPELNDIALQKCVILNSLISLENTLNSGIVWRAMIVGQILKRMESNVMSYVSGISKFITDYHPFKDPLIVKLLNSLNESIERFKTLPNNSEIPDLTLSIFRSLKLFASNLLKKNFESIYWKEGIRFEEWKTEIELEELAKKMLTSYKLGQADIEKIIQFARQYGYTFRNIHFIESLVAWRYTRPNNPFIGTQRTGATKDEDESFSYFASDFMGWSDQSIKKIRALIAIIDEIFQKGITVEN